MLSHLKRRVGVFTAIAVMAALVPALTVSTASAAPATTATAPGDGHLELACPAGSASAAGFTDTTSTDVDCIAMFGITKGVTATTYEPSASIPRWQMALYLTRTASIAGHTLGSGADQGFTDISGYSAEIQTAINQLKQLTVTTGTTATTYSPDDNVTREQMAMFVNRLLALTAAGPGGNSDSTATVNIVGNAGDVYNYTDIDGGSVTFEGHTAAVALYNLGVPGHDKTVTTFGPATNITRGEMATWLNNALDHTNARPAGLTLQFQLRAAGNWGNNSPVASVSYRDSAFAPVAGQVVDMFSWANSTTAGNTNYSADGTCNLNTNVNIVGSSLTKCTIDVGDPSTNASGNIAVGTLTSSVAAGKTTSFTAWTAAAATKYDNDVHDGLSDTAKVDQSDTVIPVQVTLSCDVNPLAGTSTTGTIANVANVHHGDTVTITAQMTTATTSGVATPVAYPANRLTVTHTIYSPNSDQTVASTTTSRLDTDATGAASYSFTSTDPNLLGATPAATDDVIHSVLIVDHGADIAEALAPAIVDGKPCFSTDVDAVPMYFDFQDTVTDAALTATLTTNTAAYKAGSATAPVSRTATVTVTDKFGDAKSGGTVQFHGGANPVVIKASAASGNDLISTARMTSFGYAANSAICFTGVNTALAGSGELSLGTVHYIKAINADAESDLSFSLSSGGTELTLSGTPTANEMGMVKAHPVMGCASRTVSPAGTASVAWNDTTATAGMDVVGATTRHLQAMTTDNAQVAAADTNAVHATKTAYRWIAPGTTTLATSATSSSWAEVDTATNSGEVGGAAGDGVANNDADINGTPLVVDLAGNSMVVGLNYGKTTSSDNEFAGVATAATGAGLIEVTSANGKFPIGTAVCFTNTDASGGKLGVAVAGVVYYVKSVVFETSWNDLVFTTTLSALGIPTTDLVITGTPTTSMKIGYAIQDMSGAWKCSPTTYTSYSWDDNDYFYLNSAGGTTTTPTTMAGFEGAYVAGVATYGLQGALATGNGLSYATGTLDAITYQALAANKSIWKLGG